MRKIHWYEMPIDSPLGKLLVTIVMIAMLTVMLLVWAMA